MNWLTVYRWFHVCLCLLKGESAAKLPCWYIGVQLERIPWSYGRTSKRRGGLWRQGAGTIVRDNWSCPHWCHRRGSVRSDWGGTVWCHWGGPVWCHWDSSSWCYRNGSPLRHTRCPCRSDGRLSVRTPHWCHRCGSGTAADAAWAIAVSIISGTGWLENHKAPVLDASLSGTNSPALV